MLGSKGCTMLGKTDTREPVAGVVPVYVGEEGNKYNVPVEFFSSDRIKELLEKYEDEFEAGKPLSLPCSEKDFETVLHIVVTEIEEKKKKRRNIHLSVFEDECFYTPLGSDKLRLLSVDIYDSCISSLNDG
ncbi:hypothetical protein RJ639_017814 [Escallonia herrerae]|uniref:Small auxin up regulated protein n=1 Tax=Escallonia herrerae TaxID=1293975 RepID=A0AA88VDI9_9ASTE|nr:hypothetical protein RJ639_017814 [Escallonia herrerae]